MQRARGSEKIVLRQFFSRSVKSVLDAICPSRQPRQRHARLNPDRGLVGLGHAIDIGGNLNADRRAVLRLVAGNLDPKCLIRRCFSSWSLGCSAVDLVLTADKAGLHCFDDRLGPDPLGPTRR